MIVFPPCKINLGLSVLDKRSDGFHNLETVFYPIAFTDVLEIIADPSLLHPATLPLSTSGLVLDGDPEQNLCAKAYRLLQTDFPGLPPVRMHLHKIIPAGAGLGGGSADGAFTLQALNRLLQLSLSDQQLAAYAAILGSDCSFFLHNKPCLAKGRGELLTEIALSLDNYSLLLVHPSIHINTGWAFSQLALHPPAPRLAVTGIVQQPIDTWKENLFNDFEQPVFLHYPVIGSVKTRLYEQGALYASLSGSGSTVFGIFPKNRLPDADAFPDFKVSFVL